MCPVDLGLVKVHKPPIMICAVWGSTCLLTAQQQILAPGCRAETSYHLTQQSNILKPVLPNMEWIEFRQFFPQQTLKHKLVISRG